MKSQSVLGKAFRGDKTCNIESCRREVKYRSRNGHAKYCAIHALDGVIKYRAPGIELCDVKHCSRQATFISGQFGVKFCAHHSDNGIVKL
jgi:hypothetical protein